MSESGHERTLATYRCHVRSWVTSGRGEEVVGTSVHSYKQTTHAVQEQPILDIAVPVTGAGRRIRIGHARMGAIVLLIVQNQY